MEKTSRIRVKAKEFIIIIYKLFRKLQLRFMIREGLIKPIYSKYFSSKEKP